MILETVPVALGERSYDVAIGKGMGPPFREWLAHARPGAEAWVVTDRNVASLYRDDIGSWLAGVPHRVLVLPPGEESKTWETVRDIYAFLATGGPGAPGGAGRDAFLVAFGGGVVGDLAGFAAATFLRGLPYVQVPTTLLAQLDSSVGGKTGFNLPEGKNLVGAFHQPRAVFVDRSFLATLDERNLRAGMAEAVKCALAGDRDLWELLAADPDRWRSMADREWQTVVRRSVAYKASVVAGDERESGARRVLNLGHTIGHALEKATGYGRHLHGEAVAMGLAWEAVFASRRGVTPPGLAARVCALLGAMGFALDDVAVDLAALAPAIPADKKRIAADLVIPMVTEPGRCELVTVPVAALAGDLAAVRAEIGRLADAVPLARREAPAASPSPAPPVPGPAARKPAAIRLVRTITMAGVCWAQGKREEARAIVEEILRADPSDARARAWLDEHAETPAAEAPVRRLAAFLESIAKEYGHDLSGSL